MSASTLAAPATHVLEVRHSRFVAQAAPVVSAAEAQEFLRAAEAPDANHNCWAWRIGGNYRSSDGACPEQGRRGEPAGTAGRPILAAIDGQGCDRVVVVVARWFGGIKLGTGGLVRAYGGAAAECLRLAPRVPIVETATLAMHVAFDDLGILHTLLPGFDAEKRDEAYDTAGARIVVELPASAIDALKSRLCDATRDRVRFDDHG